MTVLRYSKTLVESPPVARCAAYTASEYAGLSDAQAWLDLRNSALHEQTCPGRDWLRSDFQREFLDQPWFDPTCFWLTRRCRPSTDPAAAGSLVLQLDQRPVATIRWLLVAPDCRRQGIASHLLTLAERVAWQRGRRQVEMETLSTWQPACQFYEAHGYQTV